MPDAARAHQQQAVLAAATRKFLARNAARRALPAPGCDSRPPVARARRSRCRCPSRNFRNRNGDNVRGRAHAPASGRLRSPVVQSHGTAHTIFGSPAAPGRAVSAAQAPARLAWCARRLSSRCPDKWDNPLAPSLRRICAALAPRKHTRACASYRTCGKTAVERLGLHSARSVLGDRSTSPRESRAAAQRARSRCAFAAQCRH